jgi:long-chain acyl-CoA synthetase
MTLSELTGPGGPFEIAESEGPRGVTRNFIRRERSLREMVERAARRGDKEFLIQGDRRVTFADFTSLVWGTAGCLIADEKLSVGDRVAIVAANSIDWIVSAFAVASAGGVVVPLNPQWMNDELAFAISDCAAQLVLSDGERENTTPFSHIVRPGSTPPTVRIDEEDPFAILYTSGTTGRPKGCITTHRGTIAQVRSVILAGLQDREPTADRPRHQPVLLQSSPLFHVSGLHAATCLALAVGMKTVLTPTPFDPRAVLQLIEQERVTSWGAVPTMVHRVVDCPDAASTDLSSIESISIGGAALPPSVLERAQAVFGLKPKLGNGYGLTEAHGPVTMNAGRSLLQRPGSVGRPGPLVDLRINDADDRPAPVEQVGEVCLRGPTITPGYWNRNADNHEVFLDGWFRTGDLGYLDEDGFLYLVDRLKDMIIRGGENIYCVEVEDAIAAAPGVDEAAVFGIPDEEMGERVAAVVRTSPGWPTSAQELRTFLEPTLARYKIPERFEFTSEPLPRNAGGKVMKGDLKRRVNGEHR